METFVIGAAFLGSCAAALALQRAALEGLFWIMQARRTRQ